MQNLDLKWVEEMNNFKTKKVYFIFLIFILFSCRNVNKTLCGELKGEWKDNYEEASKEYPKLFSIEAVPCESYYINISAKTNNIDTLKISSLHRILYNEQSKIGWLSLKVYDRDGKFVFSRHFSGKISDSTN